jgi:hypothetical protein
LAECKQLRSLGGEIKIDLFHLERVATILDRPHMGPVRRQYLRIAAGPLPMLIKADVIGVARRFVGRNELMAAVVRLNDKREREREHEAPNVRPKTGKGGTRTAA